MITIAQQIASALALSGRTLRSDVIRARGATKVFLIFYIVQMIAGLVVGFSIPILRNIGAL